MSLELKLTSEDPLLKHHWLDFSTSSMEEVWVGKFTRPDLAETAIQTFRSHFSTVQDFLKKSPLMGRIQPGMHYLNGFQFLYLFLKSQVDEYFLDHPDDLPLKEEWGLFCYNFALLRYRKDPILVDQVNLFLNQIHEKLRLKWQNGVDSQVSYGTQVMSAFKKMNCDPDLFDVNLGSFFGMGTPVRINFQKTLNNPDKKVVIGRKIPVSVCDLQSTFYLIAREIQENYHWLLNLIREKITLYSELLSHMQADESGTTYDEIFKGGLRAFEGIQPLINGLRCESIEEILNKTSKINNLEKIMMFLTAERFGCLDDILADFKKNGSIRNDLEEKIQASVKVMEAFNQVHMLLDAHFTGFVHKLAKISEELTNWSQALKKKPAYKSSTKFQNFLRSIPRVIETTQFLGLKPAVSGPCASRNIDETLAFIGTSHQVNTGRRPRGRKGKLTPAKQRVAKKILREVQSPSLAVHVEPTPLLEPILPVVGSSQPSLPVSLETQILETVLQKIPEQPWDKTPYLRSSLRQVELALSSLVNEYEKVHRIAPEDFESYDYHAMISKMYYLIEQVLRYKNIERDPSSGDFNHHVLERLQKLGDYNNPIAGIVKKLFSANLWNSYTESQITSRQRINLMNDRQRVLTMPPILSNLHEIIYAPTPELRVRLKNEIESLYRETLAFVAFYIPPEIQEGPSIKLSTKSCKVTLETTFDLATIGLFQQKLNGVIDGQFGSDMKDKLDQGKRNLSFLKRTLKDLTSSELTLEQFSPLLRSTIHLTHQVCESVLQLLFIKKHGIETQEHQLNTLIEACLEASPEGMTDFFRLHFQGINTGYRYPFDLGSIRSFLHQLILEAEFLRERTELEEGFAFVGETASTSLNFIKLPEVAFTTQKIWSRASVILSQALNLVFEDVLSRFNGRFSGASSSHSR